MGDDATDVELDTAPEVRAAAAVVLERVGPLVRRALVARFGTDVGADAAADAIAWGWEHGRAITSMANPGGYLYRVGQTSARRAHRRVHRSEFPVEPVWTDAPHLGGDVFDALHRLKADQRVAVLMVHGYGFSYRETADVLEVSESAVRNHVHRGMRRLRSELDREQRKERW